MSRFGRPCVQDFSWKSLIKKGFFFIKVEKLWSVRLDGLFGSDYRSTVASAISGFEAHHCLNTDELPLFLYRNRNGLTNCSLIEMFDVGNVRTKRARISKIFARSGISHWYKRTVEWSPVGANRCTCPIGRNMDVR